MAPRKQIRRDGDAAAATLPPPVVAPVVPSPSKFIEARPVGKLSHALPTKNQIRERAYQIYLARNGAPGDATSDWVQAERELTEEARRIPESRSVS